MPKQIENLFEETFIRTVKYCPQIAYWFFDYCSLKSPTDKNEFQTNKQKLKRYIAILNSIKLHKSNHKLNNIENIEMISKNLLYRKSATIELDFQKWFLFIDTLNDISKINY